MKRAVRALSRWWIALPALAVYMAAVAAPARWWFDPVSVVIGDAPAGSAPMVTVNRTTRSLPPWPFLARYSVDVRLVGHAGAPACNGSGEVRYLPGLTEPASMDLVQWADDNPRCGRLTAGEYFAETCWTIINPLFLFIVPPKTVCAVSNPFRIGDAS